MLPPNNSGDRLPTFQFKDGDLLEREYDTPQGTVGLLAEIKIEGKTLHLNDIAVYPIKTSGKLSIGPGQVIAARRELALYAKNAGFEKLHITAKRTSGAKPGKLPDRWIDLTKL